MSTLMVTHLATQTSFQKPIWKGTDRFDVVLHVDVEDIDGFTTGLSPWSRS